MGELLTGLCWAAGASLASCKHFWIYSIFSAMKTTKGVHIYNMVFGFSKIELSKSGAFLTMIIIIDSFGPKLRHLLSQSFEACLELCSILSKKWVD